MNKILVFLLWVVIIPCRAQLSTIKKAQQNYDHAQEYLRQNAFDEGINYLEQAVKADPKFQAAHIQLGDVYKRLKNYPKAVDHYQKAISAAATIDRRIYFALGESELLTGNYSDAKTHLLHFRTLYLDTDATRQKTEKYLTDCDFALNALKIPVTFEPVNMGSAVNSEYRDYFPALTADGETLIFSRVINGNEDFYTSHKINGEWQKAIPLSPVINTPLFNEGAQSVSPDGKYLFFTGCNRPDGLGRCDIYLSRKEGKQWGKAINLGPVINSEYWDAQPAISPDGSTLYFVSNRPGGQGGYDIWKSTLNAEAKWTAPVNLGPEINTPFDESTPFMHADGKSLYFSSDGWPGMGNKDIFMSRTGDDGRWSRPKNLGYPINTFNEETGFIVSANGKEALFSSNLQGGFGNVDLYRFILPEEYRPLPVSYVKGIVIDRQTRQFLEASVLVIDLQTKADKFNDNTSAETGDFLTVLPSGSRYSFHVYAPGYLLYSQHYDLQDKGSREPFQIEIALDKIRVGANATLANLFFDTNKYELLPASKIELELLIDFLMQNDKICIEIAGHTDNTGDDTLNQNLSINRAKAVYDYLKTNGIDAARLRYKGYGASQPKADNSSEEGRQLNRRTEFMIIKT